MLPILIRSSWYGVIRHSFLELVLLFARKNNLYSVAFSGDWKKVSTTGAEEFFAAHEVKPENVEKLKKSALAEMITHMKDNGSSLTFSRTLTLDG